MLCAGNGVGPRAACLCGLLTWAHDDCEVELIGLPIVKGIASIAHQAFEGETLKKTAEPSRRENPAMHVTMGAIFVRIAGKFDRPHATSFVRFSGW